MTPEEIEEMAAGLTPDQRRALSVPNLLIIDGCPSVPLLDWPESMTIYEWQDHAALSETGLSVRAILEAQNDRPDI
jgi:hypothetical protein